MKTFEITFKHTIEETYTAHIEAETEDEARELLEDEGFDHLVDEEPSNIDGLRIDIIKITEL